MLFDHIGKLAGITLWSDKVEIDNAIALHRLMGDGNTLLETSKSSCVGRTAGDGLLQLLKLFCREIVTIGEQLVGHID